nr:hypothetical protein [Streptomyces sp. HNM0574]
MTDRSVNASCLLGARSEATRFDVTRVNGVSLSGTSVLLGGSERPIKAPAAAMVKAHTYAFAPVANGAGVGRERTQHQMWAFRGLEPWRDPA